MKLIKTHTPMNVPGRSPLAWRAACASFALLCSTPLLAQDDLPYDSGSTGADGALDVPEHVPYREDATAVYDAARGEVVLFGGNWGNTYYPETWTFNGERWTKKTTATFVSGRRDHAMVYDPQSERVILFGGRRADNTLMNDMWSWNGTDWTPMNPATRPPVRESPVMAVDPATGDILLFGGYGDDDDPNNGIQQVHRNDTWLYDASAGNWVKLTPATNPSQNYAEYKGMVYHPGLGGWFMYDEANRKTWLYSGANWSEITTATSPNVGYKFGLAYDSVRGEVVLHDGGNLTTQTWVFRFEELEWVQMSPATVPPRRRNHSLVFDPVAGVAYSINGWQDNISIVDTNGNLTSTPNYNTYAWDGTNWSYVVGRVYQINMNEKPDGIWNFTTINIPATAEVRFTRNTANTPVQWLASGPVTINGIIRVDGSNAFDNDGSGNFAPGGPGGGSGGLGGIRVDVSGSNAGTPGQGPGGGLPGTVENEYGQNGRYKNVYGNSLLQPLWGGSGGGGGASDLDTNGGHGGGGGGAILIASSRDITINGSINADGGQNRWSGETYGGEGSGGAIRLIADRVLGSGRLYARGGRSYQDDRAGRIRIEAYYRPLAASAFPPPSATAPVIDIVSGEQPTLSIISIDGAAVTQPPSGDPRTPDVIFTDGAQVQIVVQGTNIPEGTPVTLRISASGQIINLPAPESDPVTLGVSGTAVFTTVVPAGVGTVQAFAEFDIQ